MGFVGPSGDLYITLIPGEPVPPTGMSFIGLVGLPDPLLALDDILYPGQVLVKKLLPMPTDLILMVAVARFLVETPTTPSEYLWG